MLQHGVLSIIILYVTEDVMYSGCEVISGYVCNPKKLSTKLIISIYIDIRTINQMNELPTSTLSQVSHITFPCFFYSLLGTT